MLFYQHVCVAVENGGTLPGYGLILWLLFPAHIFSFIVENSDVHKPFLFTIFWLQQAHVRYTSTIRLLRRRTHVW